MSQQSGSGLSGDGVARARRGRIERLRGEQAWSASDASGQLAALRAAGFEPVGQVLGISVRHVCAATRSTLPTCTYQSIDLADAFVGVADSQVVAPYDARQAVLGWALAECRALGGDGIVGVRLREEPHPTQGTQVTVEGTAVRARSRVRPSKPFTTHVSGPDFARLLGGGWMPFAVVFGLAVGSEHQDAATRLQARAAHGVEGNVEVESYTRLVNSTRNAAREQLAAAVRACGGQGVVTDELTLRTGERECPTWERGRDHLAEASVLGSALVALPPRRRTAARTALPIMRLNDDPHPPGRVPWPFDRSRGDVLPGSTKASTRPHRPAS